MGVHPVMPVSEQHDFCRARIGLPWERGATGPEAWDCGSFTAHVQAQLFARRLPVSLADYGDLSSIEALRQALADADLAGGWPVALRFDGAHEIRRMTSAGWRHGDVVLMRRGEFCHLGTWLDLRPYATGLLHCARFDGVKLEKLMMVRGQGWNVFEVRRPAELA